MPRIRFRDYICPGIGKQEDEQLDARSPIYLRLQLQNMANENDGRPDLPSINNSDRLCGTRQLNSNGYQKLYLPQSPLIPYSEPKVTDGALLEPKMLDILDLDEEQALQKVNAIKLGHRPMPIKTKKRKRHQVCSTYDTPLNPSCYDPEEQYSSFNSNYMTVNITSKRRTVVVKRSEVSYQKEYNSGKSSHQKHINDFFLCQPSQNQKLHSVAATPLKRLKLSLNSANVASPSEETAYSKNRSSVRKEEMVSQWTNGIRPHREGN